MNNATFDTENLLNTLTEQGRNERRQQKLLKQIDQLAKSEMPKRRKLLPWIASAISVAACLLLIIFTGNKEPQTIASAPQKEVLIEQEQSAIKEATISKSTKDLQQRTTTEKTRIQKPENTSEQIEIETTTAIPVQEGTFIAEAIIPETYPQEEIPAVIPQRRVVETNSLIAYNDGKHDSKTEGSIKVVPKSFLGIPYDENMTNTLFAYNFASNINKKQ